MTDELVELLETLYVVHELHIMKDQTSVSKHSLAISVLKFILYGFHLLVLFMVADRGSEPAGMIISCNMQDK